MTQYRIGAISHTDIDTNEVFLLGFGVYCGEEVPPPGIKFLGMDANKFNIPDEKLLLDSGDIVWGCECWWGEESVIRESLKGKTVIEVTIENERANAATKLVESKKETHDARTDFMG